MVHAPTRDTIYQYALLAQEAIAPHIHSPDLLYEKRHKRDIVTIADIAADKAIVDAILRDNPDHAIISEESKERSTHSAYTWYIDPLDGTINFSRRMPQYGSLIGLAVEQTMELAAAAYPHTREIVTAQANRGAFLRNERLRASSTEEFAYSFGCVTSSLNERKVDLLSKLLEQAKHTQFYQNAFGSCATNTLQVACGKSDWWVANEGGPWDYAAPALICQEAGCTVTRIDGSPWRVGDSQILVAATPKLHQSLVEILNQ